MSTSAVSCGQIGTGSYHDNIAACENGSIFSNGQFVGPGQVFQVDTRSAANGSFLQQETIVGTECLIHASSTGPGNGCGDARTFQGKERNIMFLSMVCAPNEGRIAPLVRNTFAQRFNVAASRAQDRMYLVRSVQTEDLSESDRLRRTLIAHFSSPFMRDEVKVEDQRKLCESPFECEVYDHLTERGFVATPQVRVGQYRIDIVVEGENDARLAIECDGDRFHGPDRWSEDMQRQRVLERAGWVFWRCFASAWIRRGNQLSQELLSTLHKLGIEPNPEGVRPKSIYSEQRRVSSTDELPAESTSGGMALSNSGSV